jgi:sphingolipid delta-4 desaturase
MHELFMHSPTVEPHMSRHREILKKYPQIAKLQRPCARTKWVVLGMVLVQLGMAYYLRSAAWWRVLLAAATLGGAVNHACSLAGHELSHNLAFRRPSLNRWLSILSDVPKMVPSAITFRRYHLEHHRYQGVSGVDMDLATDTEARVIGHGVLGKLFFVCMQVLFYAFRPVLVRPKAQSSWELCNMVVIMATNFAVVHYLGWTSALYLLLSSLLGHGLHPVAGHFIAEHYVFVEGVETYSYLGPLNYLSFNVGLHNAHHDFPKIPGSLLHEVRRIAPEYYEPLPTHHSWVKVIIDFVLNPKIGLDSRIVRSPDIVKKTLAPE